MSRWRGAAAGVLLLTAAAMLGGCAALTPAATDSPPPPPPQVRLTIDAPDEPRRLLEAHLDLARLAIVAPGEALSETELRRLEAATPAQARALLATLGYMEPTVRVQREPTAAGEPAHVRVVVTPGERSRIDRVELELQGALADAAARGDADAAKTLAAWRAAWRLPAGSVFTNNAWRDAKLAALAQLRSAGYATAAWHSTDAQVDADAAKVSVAVVADSGPLFRTGALVVQGLQRQDEVNVRNLAGFEPGTPATEVLLLDYQERLQRAGLFERATVTLATDPDQADAATVTVAVAEMPLQQASPGIGISANDGLRVSAEHTHRRAFGFPATMHNKVEFSKKRRAWEGELSTHTLPGLYRNQLGGAAEQLDSDTDRVISLSFRVGRAYETQRAERLTFVEVERGLVQPFATAEQPTPVDSDTIALTLNQHAVWRNVDNVILPTIGQSLALQGGIGRVHSSGNDAASGDFARLHARLQLWQPLGADWYGQARLELGEVFAKSAVNVPDSQRFRAGGDDSVRGYEYRSLTPQVNGVDVGGRVVATASLEVAHPISARLPTVWWAAFIDAGRAAERWQDWSAAYGAGVGVRWRSPVGPLRADIAYGEEVNRWRLHVSVGIAF